MMMMMISPNPHVFEVDKDLSKSLFFILFYFLNLKCYTLETQELDIPAFF